MRLHRFHGGLALPPRKSESTAQPIQLAALPPRLAISLTQRAGVPADACVAPGERVRRGQVIARAPGALVHASACGVIASIAAEEIVVEVDAADSAVKALPPIDWTQCDAADIVARMHAAGIVGLGGARFPTAEKLARPVALLILNGAECEPWIACDDALLRERADEVLLGGRAMQRALGAARVVLAIEHGMPQALQAARAAATRIDGVDVVAVPTRYPQGGERQLIETLAGVQVPERGLPADVGVVVQNVATAAAAWRALQHGEALVTRIVSVTGPGVLAPGNFEVAFGTPVSHLVALAGGYTDAAARLLMGGPMMGTALPHDGFAIGKETNCVLVLGAGDVRGAAPELPCIRCGDCAAACPAGLLPQQLHAFLRAGDADSANEHGLFACIECGCCDLACPSNIPLTQQFRLGKSDVLAHEAARQFSDVSRARYEARNARLARNAAERARVLAAKSATASSAVQAALERAQARKKAQ